jgi:hypothetical protein
VPESLFVVIPFDHPRKKRAVMQKANVSHGEAKKDKMARRRELPCGRPLMLLYGVRFFRGVVSMSMERKKVMKKQRRSKRIRVS